MLQSSHPSTMLSVNPPCSLPSEAVFLVNQQKQRFQLPNLSCFEFISTPSSFSYQPKSGTKLMDLKLLFKEPKTIEVLKSSSNTLHDGFGSWCLRLVEREEDQYSLAEKMSKMSSCHCLDQFGHKP